MQHAYRLHSPRHLRHHPGTAACYWCRGVPQRMRNLPRPDDEDADADATDGSEAAKQVGAENQGTGGQGTGVLGTGGQQTGVLGTGGQGTRVLGTGGQGTAAQGAGGQRAEVRGCGRCGPCAVSRASGMQVTINRWPRKQQLMLTSKLNHVGRCVFMTR